MFFLQAIFFPPKIYFKLDQHFMVDNCSARLIMIYTLMVIFVFSIQFGNREPPLPLFSRKVKLPFLKNIHNLYMIQEVAPVNSYVHCISYKMVISNLVLSSVEILHCIYLSLTFRFRQNYIFHFRYYQYRITFRVFYSDQIKY